MTEAKKTDLPGDARQIGLFGMVTAQGAPQYLSDNTL
jgi:hypothetical protein